MAREFVLKPVDVPPREGGRAKQYYPMMKALIEQGDEGQWYLLATYSTRTGARDAAKNIRNGKIQVPEGAWKIRSQLLDQPRKDGMVSGLYVMWVGELEPDDTDD